MSLKKVFSTIAAAAIAVGGLAIGASTASAAEATFGTTITLTATDKAQLEGHTFSAIRLADYASDENGYVSVTTVDSNRGVYDKIVAAAKTSNGGEALPEGVDPIAYISGASTLSALTDDDQTPGENNGTSTKPWTGEVRTFVNDLTDDDTLKNAANPVTLGEITESDGVYSADLNMGTAGLYLIFDTTAAAETAKGQDVNSIPMLVGTAIQNASNKFVDESGNETDQWPATYMGTVAVKNQTTTVSKTVNGDKKISASIGDTVNYTVKAPLPTTTGFSSTNKYNFTLTDTPGIGQNVTIDTNKDAANATFKVFVDVNDDGKYDEGDVLLPRITTNSTEANGYKLKYTNNGEGVTAPSEFVGGGEVGFIVDLANFVSSEDYQTKGYAGKNIVVQYQATITANAPSAGVTNAVEVNSQNAVAKDQTTITYGGFSFTKTDATGKNLTGAKFAIKKTDGPYLKQENGLWKAVNDAKDSARGGDGDETTGEETATFTYNGLADGTYTVEETQTPTGYMSNAKVTFKVTIKNGVAVYFDETDAVNFNNDKGSTDSTEAITDYKVKNYKSISQLPLTGGAGIALFAVVGLLLIGAGVTVHMRNRNSSQALRY